MNLRSTLFGGVAAASMVMSAAALMPVTWNPVASAEAGVDVSVNFGSFYDGLGAYGDWVNFGGRYVWTPADAGPRWRPYVYGHWVWTRHYGWLWVSNEPFGWATYHYGRWGFSYDIGWYWVPGSVWAPAWVSWRHSEDDMIWAPLPPGRNDYDVNISVNVIPDYYWNAVPARRFLEPNLSAVIIFDSNERRRALGRSHGGGNVVIENNIVVNNVININTVERRTGKPVIAVEVDNSDRPGKAVQTGDRLSIYTGNIAAGGNSKPPRVTDVETAKVKYGKRPGRLTRDSGEPEVVGPAIGGDNPPGNDAGTQKDRKNKQKLQDTGGQLPDVITGPDNGAAGDGQPQGNKKKTRNQQLPQLDQQPQGPGDQQPGKHKKNKNQQQLDEQLQQPDQPPQGNKKKLKNQQQQMDQQQPQGQGDGQQGNKNNKKKNKQQNQCDPAIDPNCPPAEQ